MKNTNLNSFTVQRQWLVSKGITDPMSVGTLEAIGSAIDWNHTRKLLDEVNRLNDDLVLLSDPATLERRDALLKRIDEVVADARTVIAEEKTRAGEVAIRRAKANELYDTHSKAVEALSDAIMADGNKYHSHRLMELADAITQSLRG